MYASKNGMMFTRSSGVVPQVKPWCSVNWIPNVPGDRIRTGAVVGGYVGNSSFKTYVIDGVGSDGRSRCDYYNLETKLGDIVAYGAEDTVEMDILVLQ